MSAEAVGSNEAQQVLRSLPSVDRLLAEPTAREIAAQFGRSLLIGALRDVLSESRGRILAGDLVPTTVTAIIERAREMLDEMLAPTLRPVINGAGVIVHTNLGRAPLSKSALQAIQAVAAGYSNLEYDLAPGARGSRTVHASRLLQRITGCEDALAVNNNAAAVLLMLTALCRDREVIISRGQLVEIGGGFRVPDVMAQSGARLVEVGTTNRTHPRDYEQAINERTGAILVAHHSNFRIVGFTAEPELAELVQLAHEHGIPLLFDQGSGALIDTEQFGLAHEPLVGDALAAGVDVVAFSGDKLLGGPQAGILCGKAALLAPIKRHPLARAVRADKSCLAALNATLLHYVKGEVEREIPVWRMIGRAPADVHAEALRWAGQLQAAGIAAGVIPGESTVGGGSLPGAGLPTFLLAIDAPRPDELAADMRSWDPPIIGRIAQDQFLLDPRTVLDGQGEVLVDALTRLLAPAARSFGGGPETT